MTSPTRATHRCLSLPPQIGVHEGALESVHEREFAKFLFSLQSFVWRTQRGLIRAPAIPETGCRRTSEVHRKHSPKPPGEAAHDSQVRNPVFSINQSINLFKAYENKVK